MLSTGGFRGPALCPCPFSCLPLACRLPPLRSARAERPPLPRGLLPAPCGLAWRCGIRCPAPNCGSALHCGEGSHFRPSRASIHRRGSPVSAPQLGPGLSPAHARPGRRPLPSGPGGAARVENGEQRAWLPASGGLRPGLGLGAVPLPSQRVVPGPGLCTLTVWFAPSAHFLLQPGTLVCAWPSGIPTSPQRHLGVGA